MAETPNQTPKSGGQSSGLDPNVASGLSYLCGWLTGLIFLLLEKDNKEVKFHAWQAIWISIFSMGYFVVTFILSFIPFLGLIFGIINILVSLGLLALIIVCMIKAFQGGRLTLPVISELADKQANK